MCTKHLLAYAMKYGWVPFFLHNLLHFKWYIYVMFYVLHSRRLWLISIYRSLRSFRLNSVRMARYVLFSPRHISPRTFGIWEFDNIFIIYVEIHLTHIKHIPFIEFLYTSIPEFLVFAFGKWVWFAVLSFTIFFLNH